MRVAIIGHRYVKDFKYVMERFGQVMDKVDMPESKPATVCFVTGGATTGVDSMIKLFADKQMIDLIQFEPHFVLDKNSKYSPRDFFTRNRQIVNNSDILIAFAHPDDSGTAHAITYADKKGKAVFTVPLVDKQIGDKDDSFEAA